MINKSQEDCYTTTTQSFPGETSTEISMLTYGDGGHTFVLDDSQSPRAIYFTHEEFEAMVALYNARGLKEAK